MRRSPPHLGQESTTAPPTEITYVPSSPLALPNFRLYLCAALSANIGYRVQFIALGILVYRLTSSPLDLGVISAVGALPAVLCNVLGGVLADRYDTRKVWMANSTLAAAAVTALALLAYFDALNILSTYLLAALMGLVFGVNVPVTQAYFPTLSSGAPIKRAVALNGVAMSAASIIGPTLSGLIVATLGLAAAFAVAALCWAATAIIALFLPPRRVEAAGDRHPLQDFRVGFAFVRAHKLFLVLCGLATANFLLVFGWLQMLPAFVAEFSLGDRQVGYVFTAAGTGATLGTLLSGRLRPGRFLGWQIALAALLFYGSVVTLSSVSSFVAVLLLAALAHLGNGLSSNSNLFALQSRTPEAVRGRVMGVVSTGFTLGTLGGLWTGAMAALVGDIRLGIAIGPCIMILAVLILLATQPVFRKLAEVDSDQGPG
ncbi:MAG: MFS transporter [Candidatus Latescibacteria bacterium]|nr:MFS transporter [Candidatus Latescibacterota bacterium]